MSSNIVILASGTGTNARQIIDYFKSRDVASVVAVISNKAHSGALSIAEQAGIRAIYIANEDIDRKGHLLQITRELHADIIVLAGFLRKIPADLVDAFPHRMLNIHPALLPRHGGKGMYGRYVHEAVIEAGDTNTGITIHEVNNEYDKGKVIFQASCTVDPDDSPESLAEKVQQLEHQFFPEVIEQHIKSLNQQHAH